MSVSKVTFEEVKNIAEYELEREKLRPQMMALKDRRRVRVGDHLTFLFENHDTVLYQIQEMMRIERLVRREDIEHEIKTYNELIPKPYGLSASLLIEYESPQERDVWLRQLLGLENHVWMQIADTPAVRASFDTRQISTDRLSSVQYISFQFTPEQAARLREGARIIVDHPHYQAETQLTPEQIEELAKDLQ